MNQPRKVNLIEDGTGKTKVCVVYPKSLLESTIRTVFLAFDKTLKDHQIVFYTRTNGTDEKVEIHPPECLEYESLQGSTNDFGVKFVEIAAADAPSLHRTLNETALPSTPEKSKAYANFTENIKASPVYKEYSKTDPINPIFEILNLLQTRSSAPDSKFLELTRKYDLMPSRIMIRDSYVKLLELIKPNLDKSTHVMIMGTPGVGKSLFGIFLLKKLMEENRMFIYDYFLEPQHQPIVSVSGVILSEDKGKEVLDNPERYEGLVYVVDGKAPASPYSILANVTTVLICSPRTAYFKEFSKNTAMRELNVNYMPPWTLEEVLEYGVVHNGFFNYNTQGEKSAEEILEERFMQIGGVPRYLFTTEARFKRNWEHITNTIKTAQDPSSLIQCNNRDQPLESAMHSILHIYTDEHDFSKMTYQFASGNVANQVALRFEESGLNKLQELYSCLAPTMIKNIERSTIHGQLFEQYCIGKLIRHQGAYKYNAKSLFDIVDRTKFKMFTRKGSRDSRALIYTPTFKKVRLYQEVNTLKKLGQYDDETLFTVPREFPTIDGFTINNRQKSITLFQVTLSPSHTITLADKSMHLLQFIFNDELLKTYQKVFVWLVTWNFDEMLTETPVTLSNALTQDLNGEPLRAEARAALETWLQQQLPQFAVRADLELIDA